MLVEIDVSAGNSTPDYVTPSMREEDYVNIDRGPKTASATEVVMMLFSLTSVAVPSLLYKKEPERAKALAEILKVLAAANTFASVKSLVTRPIAAFGVN